MDEDAVSGRYVIIQHSNGKGKPVSYTAYMHLCEVSAKQGSKVRAGEEIGQSGDTGNAVGEPDHLHFEIRTGRRGPTINPMPEFDKPVN